MRLARINKKKFKRTHYFIAKRFQLKYIGLILLLMFLTAVLCSYVVYYTSMIAFGEKLASVYPQGRLVSIIDLVNFRILISVLLITPFVALIGVFLSHKIAGPVYRMEKFLRDMAAGDLSTPLVLRKGDELTEVADGINYLSDNLKSTIREQGVIINRMTAEIESMKKGAACGDVVTRLEKEINGLKTTLDKYRV